jgi:hypothetical protein
MATKFKSSVEIDGYLSLTSGNWVQVPDGTTAQRPGSPTVGMFRYNTTTNEFEGYFGSTPAWGAIGGGGGTVTEAFKTIAVSGQSDIVADSATDTLNIAAGSNVTLTTDAATDTLTIGSTASGGGTVTVQRNNYTGDGTTTVYGVSSTIISENNIQIYLDGVYQDKDTYTTSGSNVTFGTAPPNTTAIEIMHYVAVDGIIEVDEFVGDGTTTSYNTSLSIINENATQVYISGVYQSKLTYQTTGNNVIFNTAPPNGANIEVVHIKAYALSGFEKNNFTGNGSTTVFTLNQTVNEENMTFVFLEGIYQDKSTYSISGTSLTFTTAPQNGYAIEVMVLGSITASTNALYTDTFTGDGSTVAYALGITPVDLNAVEVYLNGLYQNVSTLTLNANTLTFATAPPNGVIIEVRSVGFLNSGGTLAPATLTGGTGINVTTNSPNNFTIANTLGAGIDWDTTIQTSTFSANPGKGYIVNTTAGEITINLPAGVAGNFVVIQDYAGTFDTNKIIINSNGSEKIQGSTDNYQCAIENATIYLLYQDATKGWTADNITVETNNLIASGGTETTAGGYKYHTFTASGNLTVTSAGTFEYLMVAGGGAGGYDGGGGGGAGGLLHSSSATITTLGTYPIVIGAGGAAVTGYTQPGSGTATTFNSLTAVGGGAASYCAPSPTYTPSNATLGGSGGGGMLSNSNQTSQGGAGTAGQGNAGGNGMAYSGQNWRGAGGGGASAAGADNPTGAGGDGGDGTQFSAWATATSTGASGYYAGGGGGAAEGSTTYGQGGAGGGGRGGSINSGQNTGSPGDTNTGGGGGGSDTGSSGAGGSGIVIIRYQT